MKCWYDGLLQLRKGDIVKITKGLESEWQGHRMRVSVLEVLTTGNNYSSRINGLIMANPPQLLASPVIGRIVNSRVEGGMSSSTTFFEIEEGSYQDHVFIRPGEINKGQSALTEILKNRIDEYVKVWDPYISVDTIKLLSNVEKSKDILILSQKITDLDSVNKEAEKLPNKIIIRKGVDFHDRFILTRGEGWTIGHSLKDFGTKTSQLTKLVSSLEAETAFDENWIQSQIVFP